MDNALYQQLEQERLLNQVTSQVRQSLELSVILSTAVERLQQFLQVDRLLIYQFDFQWSVPSGECPIETGSPTKDKHWKLEAVQMSFPERPTQRNSKKRQGCVTYEARSSESIFSVLHLNEADYCWNETLDYPEKYRKGYTQVVDDVEQSYASSPCFLDFLRRIQVRAKVVLSIVVQDKLWGLLIAHQCSTPRQWKESETKFLTQITEHLSIAIFQAQLYAQVQQQKETLERRVIDRTQALHDALLAAQSANRAKSEFLATMSHELRTPLTCVIGISATLLRLYQQEGGLQHISPEKQRDYLQKINESGEHLLELINDILELSQVEAGKTVLQVREFSLTQLANQCLHLFHEKAQQQGVSLTSDIDILPEQEQFTADHRRLGQILSNLLSNAIKFTPEGGIVRLKVRVDQKTAIFQVKDTGIGISPEQQPLLFEKFQQLDSSYRRQYGGTGLGLALTKQLVELHGGVIKFQSTVNVGSTFTVYLPALPLPSQGFQNNKTVASSFKTSLQTVYTESPLGRFILIEDDEETATLICEILTAAGYQVVWLVEGLTALEQIQLLQPTAVIVDLYLPGQDGYEVIQYLKQNQATQHIQILALIPSTDPEKQQQILAAGADDYLTKPIQPNQLLNKIISWSLSNPA